MEVTKEVLSVTQYNLCKTWKYQRCILMLKLFWEALEDALFFGHLENFPSL